MGGKKIYWAFWTGLGLGPKYKSFWGVYRGPLLSTFLGWGDKHNFIWGGSPGNRGCSAHKNFGYPGGVY